MILSYYPDTDTLDIRFRTPAKTRHETLSSAEETARKMAQEASVGPPEVEDVETYEADSSGQTLAHYREGRLEEMTIEHASRRAPESWDIASLRREAAQVAASTGRIVESVTHDLIHDRTSFQTGERGPQSPHTSDDAVQEYNQMIDEIETASSVV